MQEEYGTEYGRRNEGKKEKGFDGWAILGLIIGLLLGVGFLVGYVYEAHAGEIAKQVAQKCAAIMDILRAPAQPSQSEDVTVINVTMHNANPPATEPMADVETEWIDCQPDTDLLVEIEANKRAEEALEAEMNAANEKLDPTADYAVVDIDVRLRDLSTEDLTWLDDDGIAELGADQYVTVWVNLPDGIDKLDARFESSYPAEIKAGETGTIDVCIICYDNQTKYVGSLTISATDDLTLGTARRYTRHVTYSGFEVEHGYFWDVEDETRLHTHAAYALYTSCDSDTEMYDKYNGIYGSGISVRYNLCEK